VPTHNTNDPNTLPFLQLNNFTSTNYTRCSHFLHYQHKTRYTSVEATSEG
jgi:hypothetical protein